MQELIWNSADMIKHAVFQIPSHQRSDEASLRSSVRHRSRGQTAETRLVTANLSLSLAFLVFRQSDKGSALHTSFVHPVILLHYICWEKHLQRLTLF